MEQSRINELMALLKERFEQGKIIINSEDTLNAMLGVRYDQNGDVDMTTVDSNLKALAIAIEIAKHEEELLLIPLKESQEEYFELLETIFGQLYREMIKKNLNPQQVSQHISNNPASAKHFIDIYEEIGEKLIEFWNYYYPVVQAHLRNIKGIKSVFGGDIFPSYTHNISKTSGLYVDTIILPCPLIRTSSFFKQMEKQKAVRYYIKHALNVLQYKELALADINPPIIVIAPDKFILDENMPKILNQISLSNVITHIGNLFDLDFKSEDEAKTFLSKISNKEQLLSNIVNPKYFLEDTDFENESLDYQIDDWLTTHNQFIGFNDIPLGEQLIYKYLGRMMQINEVVLKSNEIQGSPLIDAPTSWQYLLWKYEYDFQKTYPKHENAKSFIVSNALSNLDMGLIGNLSNNALIKLRKEGALNDLREILLKGIEEIEGTSSDSFQEVSKTVFHNLKSSFEDHQKKLEDLKNKSKKFFGVDVSSALVVGGISIAAAFSGNPFFNAASALAGMAGATNIKDVIKKGTGIVQDRNKIRSSPVGILIKHSR